MATGTGTSLPHTKVYSKIHNGLAISIDAKNTSVLKEVFDCKISEATKICVEMAVRDYLLKKVCKVGEINLETIKIVAQITIDGARNDVCPISLPVMVLSDAFDCITIPQCEELFTFVEENVSVFKEPLFFTPCKNQVLRMCNDVLRRLSRSQNTIFCGRILLFLARFFPFSERSGLNLISEFNLENITAFTDGDGAEGEAMEVEGEEGKTEKPAIDYTLYTKFWSLQDFFRNPVQCHQKGSWTVLIKYTEDILEAFSSFKLQANQPDSPRKREAVTVCEPHKYEEYFPKYLTNQKLLDLQFSDSNFRRYILVQILILAQYLTTNIKFKQEQLSNDQYLWVRKIAEKSYSLLAETPPNGAVFVEIAKHILKREDMWNDWKNNGCPLVEKPGHGLKRPLNGKEDPDVVEIPQEKVKKRRKLGDLIKEADAKKEFCMGNSEMTRLWNICPDNLQSCKQEARDFVPALETYFVNAIEQVMRESNSKDKNKLVNDSNFGWRGLRLLATKSPHFFTHSTQSISTLPEYLKNMIRKLAKDLNLQFDEVKVDDEEDVKVEVDQNDTKEAEPEEEEETEREEVGPISDDDRKELAAKLAKDGENWRILGTKLGMDADMLDYYQQDANSLEEAIVQMLNQWVEEEKDEATKENLVYTMGGLKLAHIAEAAFGKPEEET